MRTSRDSWAQYVGRRVIAIRYVEGKRYLAYAGRDFCGVHDTLLAAQEAAERF